MRVPAKGSRRRGRLRRRIAIGLVVVLGFLALPLALPTGLATAAPCDLSPDLAPEIVGGGVDGLVQPPAPDGSAATAVGAQVGAQQQPTVELPQQAQTNYARYGMAGQFWHTHELGCADVAAVLGNAWANTVFSWAKAIDRMTITTYQAAATEGPLQSIKDVVDDIVTNLAEAMYWPYLRPVVILGAMWLAWYGLIRKRATTTTEGVIWMVVAVTVAVWFFSRPGDFTGMGKIVTDKTGEIVNSAFAGLPGSGGASCLPTKENNGSEPEAGGYGQPGTAGVEQNADALWSTLVCKPWLMGVFGTADPSAPVVRDFGAKVLDIQAIDLEEQAANQTQDTSAHQKRFEEEFATPLQNTAIYPLIQGKDWTSRLGIAIGALIAALVAGLLIFLVAVSLLVLKVGFLLLLILAPVFLLIGVHPGSGRIIAMRWLEMVIGTLLRQAVLALVLGVLIYGYSLIISTGMPWGMQILFMALLTIAVFFYRRPFQHLFASMNGHTLTTRMLGEAASAPMLSRAANALPPVAGYRMGRWGLRKAEPLIQTAAMAGGAATAAAATAASQVRARGEDGAPTTPSGARVPAGASPAPLDTEGGTGKRRKSAVAMAAATRTGSAPPLNLPGGRSSTNGVRASGNGVTGGTVRAAGGTGGGGWFSGRSGGWARGGGSASRGGGSSGRSGGSGGRAVSRTGGSSGGSGGSLFGTGRRSGSVSRSDDAPRRDRAAEAPPLWLSSSADARNDEGPPVPFWLRPSNPDRDRS